MARAPLDVTLIDVEIYQKLYQNAIISLFSLKIRKSIKLMLKTV
jgi:hypothetical protein